jgi:hypothetical protein
MPVYKGKNHAPLASSAALKLEHRVLGLQANESVGIVPIAHIRWRTKFLHFSWEAYTTITDKGGLRIGAC